MKSKLILILIFTSAICYCQKAIPISTSKVGEVFKFIDFLKDSPKRKYEVANVDSNYKSTRELRVQLIEVGGENEINVVYRSFVMGGNKDLEIPGIRTYDFSHLTGPYLDLFPSWKLMQPEAKSEEVSSKGNVWINLDSQRLFFNSSGNSWSISKRP